MHQNKNKMQTGLSHFTHSQRDGESKNLDGYNFQLQKTCIDRMMWLILVIEKRKKRDVSFGQDGNISKNKQSEISGYTLWWKQKK